MVLLKVDKFNTGAHFKY